MSIIADDGTVGVHDLKTHLSSVIVEVMTGRMVTVTKNGHPVASIHPVHAASIEERRAAIAELRSARVGRRLGMTPRRAIAEGRR